MVRSSAKDLKVPQCCCCCNIKTGFLIYGICVSIFSLIFVPLFLVRIAQEDKTDLSHEGDSADVTDERKRIYNARLDINVTSAVVNLIWLPAAVSLIYGVTKNKPNFLLPCFCFHLVELIIGVVSLSIFCALAILPKETKNNGVPEQDDLFRQVLFGVIVFQSFFKIYILCMTWKCFTYLRKLKRAEAERGLFPEDDDMENQLLADQEDVMETSEKNYPELPVYQDHRYELSKHYIFTEPPEKTDV